MRAVELVQPTTTVQDSDVALVMRDNSPAMVNLKATVEQYAVSETWTDSRPVFPEDYGYTGSDVDVDTIALQNWAAATNVAKQMKAGTTYTMNAALAFTGGQSVDFNGGKLFNVSPNQTCDFYNEPLGPYALTADYVAGSTTLTVSSMESIPQAGTKIKIISNAVDPANRDRGSQSSQYRSAQWATVSVGSTLTQIVLDRPLYTHVGIDPTSTAGDEARVDAYTVALNARVIILKRDALHIKGLNVEYASGVSATTSAVNIAGYDCPQLSGVAITNGESGIAVASYGTTIFGANTTNCSNYHIADQGANTRVVGLIATKGRHAYTTAESTAGANTTNLRTILATGRVSGATIQGVARGFTVVAPWDTHHGADDVTFLNCLAEDCTTAAFNVRGRRVRIVSPVVKNCQSVLTAMTEFNSGDPDDDLYLAGTSENDITSCSISNVTADCYGQAFNVSVAFCDLSGYTDIKSTSHIFATSSGRFSINGSGYFTVTNFEGRDTLVANNSRGVFETTAPPAKYAGAFPTTRVEFAAGHDIKYDVSATTSTGIFGVLASATSDVIVAGKINFVLPTNTSSVLSGAGTISTIDTGLIRFSVQGAADNSITVGNSGRDVTVVTEDGTISVAPTTTELFDSRASFLAAKHPVERKISGYRQNSLPVVFEKDISGTAATTADGATWSPIGAAHPEHFDTINNWVSTPFVKRAPNQSVITSTLTIPNNTRIEGDLRLVRDPSLTGSILTIGDNVTLTGHLIISDEAVTAANPTISIGANFKALGVQATAAVENTGTLITMASGFDLGEFRSEKFARPLFLGASSGPRGVGGWIGDVEIDTFIRGVSANLIDGWRIGNLYTKNRASGASFSAGHNGLLVQGCSNWSVNTLDVEGSGEHALRIGGSADSAGSNDWSINTLRGQNTGGCVLKINDGNAYAERWNVGEVYGLGSYVGAIGRNRELLRITRARDGEIGKAVARKSVGADYSCFGPLAMDFVDGLRIGSLDSESHAGETITLREEQDGAAGGDVTHVHIDYLRSVGGSRLLDFSTTANVGNIHVNDGYFEQGAELIDVNASAVFTGPVVLRGYAAASRAVSNLAAGEAAIELRFTGGRTLIGDAVSTAQGTRTIVVAPVDPSNVSGGAMGGLTVQAFGGTPAEGLLGSGINFDRPSDSTRRGAAIVSEQTGADAYSVGLSVYSGAGTTSTDLVTKQATFTHQGDLKFVRTGRGPSLTSPDGLSTALITIDNNSRLNVSGAPLVSQLHFTSRAAFQSATIPSWCNVWVVEHASMALRYVRTATAWRTAITSANGVHGIPADLCTGEHYGAVRDGVTDDAAAINAACNAFGHCHLTYGSYAVGSTADLANQLILGAGPQATTILGLSASLSATAPIVAVGKSGGLHGVRVEYDAITGSETRGQRIAVQPYSPAGTDGANRASTISNVVIGKCGTGLGDAGNTFFSTSLRDIWITEFSHRGVDFYSQNRTGNSYDNIYVGSPANANTPLNCLNMEGDEHSSFFGQINLEHTACTGSVARFYGQVGHSINSLHIEGTDLLTANTAIIEVDSSLIQLHALNVLHTRQTADNVSLFWLRDPRSAEAQEGASFTATRQRGRLFVGNLEMRGLADPNTGLYPSYPSGRRGLTNVSGWKFVRSADTTRGWDVEVGNVSTHIYTAAANDEPIYRYAPSRYSDGTNFSLLRWGRKGPLGGPNQNFLSNGDFSIWTATSGTASASTVQGPTGWYIRTGTGSLTFSRQTEGDGLAHREFFRFSNIGASGNFNTVYQDIVVPRRLMGEKLTLSFDARASVAGRRLEQIYLEVLNAGGSPTSFYSQFIAGGNSQIQFTTDWQRFEITDDAIATSSITTWDSTATIRIYFEITGAAGTRESQIDLDGVKLEVGTVATHMAV